MPEEHKKLSGNTLYRYLSSQQTFVSKSAARIRSLYLPLCGVDAQGLKSSITPFLSGDIKSDKNHFLTKPVSTADLRNSVRNFFLHLSRRGVVSLAEGTGDDIAHVEIGQLWHKVVREFSDLGLQTEILNFIPVSGEKVELMRVKVSNFSEVPVKFTPTSSLPIFARAMANKHDHEHVTSLLNRIQQMPEGVLVEPTMQFNEEGHLPNDTVYFVYGFTGDGALPVGTFPTEGSFYGEGGTSTAPSAVVDNIWPVLLSEASLQGKEAIGALRFKEEELAPGEERTYFLVMGMAAGESEVAEVFAAFDSPKKFDKAFVQNKAYWQEKTRTIEFKKQDDEWNNWMSWVMIQPVLRRIFGCSFLPDHDYGKGGRGWRDIWQDLLSLILIEPEHVVDTLYSNFAGIRIDGSNATIIGETPGEFVADRNNISRVWSDHGAWPLNTILLYINQTGDYEILLKPQTYFRDRQMFRAAKLDEQWQPQEGRVLRDAKGEPYKGTVLEHILVQHLVPFFNVGAKNNIQLESADWNDGLDMAADKGETVAFSSFYAGNLLDLADVIEQLAAHQQITTVSLAKELCVLLDTLGKKVDYTNPEAKRACLKDQYYPSVQPVISGQQKDVVIADLVKDLRCKGTWMTEHLRAQEIVTSSKDKSLRWFNGYYDNVGARVEGEIDGRVRMTLTGQVFPVMSGVARDEDVESIVRAVDMYLKDDVLGGYRLNTDFGVPHYMNLGRAFGFAFGTKENGAVFCHMAVMYAFALYKRGFVRGGRAVLDSLYQMSVHTDHSKIYPGIPEYFDAEGRGMYHFLTGAASWFVLTQLTQVFGVRGDGGDLQLAPKLVREEFNENHTAKVRFQFAGKSLFVLYDNPMDADFDSYTIKSVQIEDKDIPFVRRSDNEIVLVREHIRDLDDGAVIHVTLDGSAE